MIGIIIFGTRGVERKIGTGLFRCPNCQADSPYVRKKVSRFFTLYFIPLIPLGTLGELIRCDRCGSQYSTEVLNLGPQDTPSSASPWMCSRCSNVNPPEYSTCVSCNSPRE